jgi:hypothetical protein
VLDYSQIFGLLVLDIKLKLYFANLFIQMQEVIDIKFIKVNWHPKDSTNPGVISTELNRALKELEIAISEYLKKGYVMKGEVSYPQFIIPNSSNYRVHHLVQTMVKYKSSIVQENLLDL